MVDDEILITKVVSILLQRNGYKILTATAGAVALELYREHAKEIKIVLTDVMMPHMDGVSLSRALKEINPQLQIVAFTGQATETRQAELRGLGINVILSKPFVAFDLLPAMHDAISLARAHGN